MITSKMIDMKGFFFVLTMVQFIGLYAQAYVDPVKLEVTVNKTTNLVFPVGIISIDRGSESIVVQKATENILRIKAVSHAFLETNLSVVTSDGKLYSFLVNYSPDPKHLTINVGFADSSKVNDPLKQLAKKSLDAKSNLGPLRDDNGTVSIELKGIYVHHQMMFFKFRCENRSQIEYSVEQMRFYIRDNKQGKRTASQELIQQPVYIAGDTGTIKGHASITWVVALTKFTIPDNKHLALELIEKNGGRHLLIRLRNSHIMHAKELSL